MKIRAGFVSNSSTSSFCIYGTIVSRSKLKEMFQVEEVWDVLDEKLRGSGLEYFHPWDDDYYIGMSWLCIKDEETAKEFKERVAASLASVFGMEVFECNNYEEAYYN